jgi:hypothetical protein
VRAQTVAAATEGGSARKMVRRPIDFTSQTIGYQHFVLFSFLLPTEVQRPLITSMQDLAEEYKWSLGEQLHELNAGGQSAAERAYHAVLDSGVPRRVLKAATGTALVVFGAVLLYIPTVILYIIMYYRYLPELVTTVPVYLQYG